jgi:hypothetical protein
MLDRVTISHHGAGYEIGQGRDFYGIWAIGSPRSQPLERWPQSPEGWYAAWARFTAVEMPGSIVAGDRAPAPAPASPSLSAAPAAASSGRVWASALIGLGVVLGVVGLFPDYLSGTSLAGQAPEIVPHALYLALWTGAAVLVLLGGARARAGALLAAATSAVTFGFFFADAGTAIASGPNAAGAGLVLALVGWVVCTAGAAVAVAGFRPIGRPVLPRGRTAVLAGVAALVGLGVVITFAPAWDSYTLHTATGQTESLTAGNAFSNPGAVIAGNVFVMIAVFAAVAVAALWRPIVGGATIVVAAAVPMVAQVISALVQYGEATPSSDFGISSSQAAQVHLQIANGLTPAFYAYCAFVAALLVIGARLFVPMRARPEITAPTPTDPAPYYGGGSAFS